MKTNTAYNKVIQITGDGKKVPFVNFDLNNFIHLKERYSIESIMQFGGKLKIKFFCVDLQERDHPKSHQQKSQGFTD